MALIVHLQLLTCTAAPYSAVLLPELQIHWVYYVEHTACLECTVRLHLEMIFYVTGNILYIPDAHASLGDRRELQL